MKNESMSHISLPIHVEETTYEVPTQWRLVGAEGKADHVIDLCSRNGFVPGSLLEVGAGDGAILTWLGKKSFCKAMHAVEISQSGVRVIVDQRIPGLVSCQLFDGYSLPFKDESFDLVILSHVLEHVEYERALLREVARISKYQIIEIPMDFGGLRNEHFQMLGPSYGHINAHSPASFRFLLSTESLVVVDGIMGQYGFAIQEYDYFVNNGREKTSDALTTFRARFERGKSAFEALSVEQQERRASFYVVLTRKESPQERTLRALKAAKSYIESGQVQAARLIFRHYVPNKMQLEASLDMARFCLQTRHWQAGQEFVDGALKIEASNLDALSLKAALRTKSIQQTPIPSSDTNGARGSTWSILKQGLKRNFPSLVYVVRRLVGR
ncbi:MAG TPA: class I SAM-dependent methyltransferase [Nitrospira sp.]|nr:class I SAM-dependent methyltransferase [Nitrospira sp.]